MSNSLYIQNDSPTSCLQISSAEPDGICYPETSWVFWNTATITRWFYPDSSRKLSSHDIYDWMTRYPEPLDSSTLSNKLIGGKIAALVIDSYTALSHIILKLFLPLAWYTLIATCLGAFASFWPNVISNPCLDMLASCSRVSAFIAAYVCVSSILILCGHYDSDNFLSIFSCNMVLLQGLIFGARYKATPIEDPFIEFVLLNFLGFGIFPRLRLLCRIIKAKFRDWKSIQDSTFCTVVTCVSDSHQMGIRYNKN